MFIMCLLHPVTLAPPARTRGKSSYCSLEGFRPATSRDGSLHTNLEAVVVTSTKVGQLQQMQNDASSIFVLRCSAGAAVPKLFCCLLHDHFKATDHLSDMHIAGCRCCQFLHITAFFNLPPYPYHPSYQTHPFLPDLSS